MSFNQNDKEVIQAPTAPGKMMSTEDKYGGLKPKLSPRLLSRGQSRRCFDSADWQLQKIKRMQQNNSQSNSPVSSSPANSKDVDLDGDSDGLSPESKSKFGRRDLLSAYAYADLLPSAYLEMYEEAPELLPIKNCPTTAPPRRLSHLGET